MTARTALAAGAVAVLGVTGFATARQLDVVPLSATETVTAQPVTMGCNDWPVTLTTGECQAAGTIRYVALVNLQGAAQFCKWRSANPGEWNRLKQAAAQSADPTGIVTWFGASIRDELLAYRVTGAPSFTMPTNDAPNVCRTPLPPPGIASVIPGQTDATVTVTTTP